MVIYSKKEGGEVRIEIDKLRKLIQKVAG